MSHSEDLVAILDRIVIRQQTEADLAALRQWLDQARSSEAEGIVIQQGKYNVNLQQGRDIHIGDRIYQGADAETIHVIIQSVLQKFQIEPQEVPVYSVHELVKQVRSRIHDDIQCLHGTMPLWGVDHWVPLGELFVDVNILAEVSSNRRSELADLWQDFSQNPSYRSLDRIGLGQERQRVSGLEVLDGNTNLMVVGKPGSGKTTYLQRVVTECNAGNLQAHRIPVLIRLREFVEDGRGVDYAVERYLERCWRLSAVEVQAVLEAGRSLVLLDGLDEVTGADGQAIAKQIKRFARDYPQVQVIVTCRTQSQESRFERFDYVEVADFNEPQVRAFAEHWFQTICGDFTAGQAKATAFLEQLFREENKPIRELAITPILLSLTCAVFQQTGKFYSKRSKLYEEGLELLLEQWDKSREIERDEIYRDLSVERKLELLSYLAVKKFEQEQYVLFEQTEIEGYIAEFLGIGLRESRGVLRAIEAQHGLLIERSQKVWSFSHLTFQEYLVAKWFQLCEDFESLSYKLRKHWKEVFLTIFEIIQNPEQIMHLMKNQNDRSLAEDVKLQDFLQWIHRKSTFYPELRAYYFELILTLETHYEQVNKPPFQLSYPPYNFDLVIKLNPSIDPSDYRYFSLSHVVSVINEIEDLITKETPVREDLGCEIMCACLQNALHSNDLEFIKEILDNVYIPNLEVKKSLSKIPKRITMNWWQKHGNNWIDTYRNAVIESQDTGYYWRFNDFQKGLLRRYDEANHLLIDCLETPRLKDCLRKEMREVLLLPIAEIENRKC